MQSYSPVGVSANKINWYIQTPPNGAWKCLHIKANGTISLSDSAIDSSMTRPTIWPQSHETKARSNYNYTKSFTARFLWWGTERETAEHNEICWRTCTHFHFQSWLLERLRAEEKTIYQNEKGGISSLIYVVPVPLIWFDLSSFPDTSNKHGHFGLMLNVNGVISAVSFPRCGNLFCPIKPLKLCPADSDALSNKQ